MLQKRQKQLLEVSAGLDKIADDLSRQQKVSAKHLEASLSETLKQLNMSNVHLKINLEKILMNEQGIDHIEFLIMKNDGSAPVSLAKYASGGEVSRIYFDLKHQDLIGKQPATLILTKLMQTLAVKQPGLSVRSFKI